MQVHSASLRLSPQASDERIMIQPGFLDKTINEVTELFISGSGYPTAQAALEGGRKWRHIMSSVFARMAMSVDFGDDDENKITPREFTAGSQVTRMLGMEDGEIGYHDRLGLFVHKTEPKRRFVYLSAGTPDVYVSMSEQEARDRVEPALQRYSGTWSDELKLAYELVHASLANDNAEARFILLVTAIEALIPRKWRNQSAVDLLDSLITIVEQRAHIENDLREVVSTLLESDKFESVRSFGLKLADRLTGQYGGTTARKYFDAVYGTRSDLAHGNLRDIPKLSRDALSQQYSELLRFVLDLLEAWTPDYSGDGAVSTGDDGTTAR